MKLIKHSLFALGLLTFTLFVVSCGEEKESSEISTEEINKIQSVEVVNPPANIPGEPGHHLV